MKTTTKILLSALLATPALAKAQGFDAPALDLPRNSSSALTRALSRSDVESLVATALSSDGDSIDFSLEGGVMRRGKGGEGSVHVTAKRSGADFELWIAAAAMKAIGFDGLGSLSVQVKHGGEATLVLALNAPRGVANALTTIALLEHFNPASLSARIEDELERLAKQNKVAAAALELVETKNKLEDKARDTVGKLKDKFTDALESFDKLKDKLNDAQKKLDDAKDKCDKAWPISEALKKLLDGAKATLRGAENAFDAAKKAKDKASDALDAGKKELDKAVRATKDAISSNKTAKALLHGIEDGLDRMRELARAVADLQSILGFRVKAVSFERAAGLDVEASAKDAGVDLGKAELSLEASTLVGASMTLTLPHGKSPSTITVRARHTASVELDVSSMQGTRSTVETLAQVDAVYEFDGFGFRFAPRASGTTFKLDLQVLSSAGKGAKLEAGVGRTIAMFVDYPTWKRAIRSVRFDASTLRTMRDIFGRVTVQDRRVLGVRAEFEREANDKSIAIEGATHWHDRGAEKAMQASLGNVAAAMTSKSWLQVALRELGASLR